MTKSANATFESLFCQEDIRRFNREEFILDATQLKFIELIVRNVSVEMYSDFSKHHIVYRAKSPGRLSKSQRDAHQYLKKVCQRDLFKGLCS